MCTFEWCPPSLSCSASQALWWVEKEEGRGGTRGDQGGTRASQAPSTPQFRPNHRPVNNWYFLRKVFIFHVFSKSENLHKNFSLEHQISNLPVVEIYLKRQTKKWPEYPKLRMSWNPLKIFISMSIGHCPMQYPMAMDIIRTKY